MLRCRLVHNYRSCRTQIRGIASRASKRRRSVANLLQSAPNDHESVEVNGWIRTIRKQKRIAFASIQDGSTIDAAQVVLSPEQAASLSTGAGLAVKGRWLASKGGTEQTAELHADEVQLQGDNDPTTYPIQKKYHTADFLRTLPHLRVRTPGNSLLLRLRSQVIADATAFFNQRNFVQTHTPLITSSDCEGAGEVFEVDANQVRRVGKAVRGPLELDVGPFFGVAKYLTVSSQLHLEALAQAVGDVWTLSPTFRAEKSDTARHLSEFYMLEVEMAFVEDLSEVMDVVEALIRFLAERLRTSTIGSELVIAHGNMLASETGLEHSQPGKGIDLMDRWNAMCNSTWPRITFQEACHELKAAQESSRVTFECLPDHTTGLQTEHERYLADVHHAGPVFVTNYPKSVKPFYMSPSAREVQSESHVPTVACFDLLLPEVCEVVGGSMREHRLEPLKAQMREHGLLGNDGHQGTDLKKPPRQTSSNLDWYLDLRRYGSVPHGGFGLGFDRLLGFFSGVKNIRDIVPFPRYYGRCTA